MQKISTFLMFEGCAEAAINFYTSIFKHSQILNLVHYKAGETGAEGTVQHATFTLNGHDFHAVDSPIKHQFTFTPSISLHVHCESVAEIDELFEKLSENGQVLMPLDKYSFSEKYAWVSDKFGVSWQLNLKNQH